MSPSIDRKTVLITGTSTGIGLHTAIHAARSGWQVIATMRDTARSTALVELARHNGVADRVEVRQLDVTDPASVHRCVSGVVDDHGHLDALINNAGSGHLGTLELEDIGEIRAVMEVNFFGVLEVTRAALPQLRATQGRVLTVSSVGGVIGQPFNEAYCAAKFAVEGFMEALAPVAAQTGVAVSVIEPGAVASEFVANVGGREALATHATGPYAAALAAYRKRTENAFANAQSPESTAQAIVEALDASDLPFRVQTSDTARNFVAVKLADLDGAKVQDMTSTWIG
ncbi:SDR family oxidoreductase [Nocardia sp. NPDC046763]|uniref:SDR family oxidoreductase n=1 Tax=Nocardia sp. NPDC046763 TaxID=3155256 RepID=UPI003402235F